MRIDYYIHYAESNLVCVIIFGILLAHDLFNMDRQEKQIKYDRALVSFMLYFLSDLFWAALIAGIVPATVHNVVAANFANFVLMAAVTYTWLSYAMAVEQAPHRNRPINKFAVLFPFLVATSALIVTYCVSPRTLLSEKLEVQPIFNLFLIIAPCINIMAVPIYTMRKMKTEKNPIERRRYLYIGFFPFMVIAGGLVQMLLLPDYPIFCFCCTILMLMFYIQSMETQISTDALTGLNNKGQLMRYISQTSNLYRDNMKTWVIMIDVNSFKAINDTYGHAEGDRALIIIADSIKAAVKARNVQAFLDRYGGDEFIIVAYSADRGEIDLLAGEIRTQIESGCRQNKTPYLLSVGIGCDELRREQDTIEKCIRRADDKLYRDKERMSR